MGCLGKSVDSKWLWRVLSTKVGSGYTMNELRELDQQLRPHWNAFDTKRPPGSIILAPGYKVSMS